MQRIFGWKRLSIVAQGIIIMIVGLWAIYTESWLTTDHTINVALLPTKQMHPPYFNPVYPHWTIDGVNGDLLFVGNFDVVCGVVENEPNYLYGETTIGYTVPKFDHLNFFSNIASAQRQVENWCGGR